MDAPTLPDDLLNHLVARGRLGRTEAAALVREVLAYYDEEVEAYVARRHAELQREGLTNPAIFERLGPEIATRRFAAPPLSARQLRRLVYG